MKRLARNIMKFIGLLVLSTLIVFGCQSYRNSGGPPLQDKPAGALRISTHNVHYILLNQDTGAWSVADWERRKDALDLAFKAIGADVATFQEMESFAGGHESQANLALDWLLQQNPGYSAAAVGDVTRFPSTQPILYRQDRLTLENQGWFFFSETPDVIYSRTFNGSYPAFASWAEFRDRQGGKSFRVVNVHFDYSSRTNRTRSAELVRDRIAPYVESGETVFLAGDINARRGSDIAGLLEAAGLTFLPVQGATYHFNRGINLFGAIDHLAYSDGAAPTGGPTIVRQKFDAEWPSDHYPVVGDFMLD